METDVVLTVPEVAKRLGYGRQHVYRLINAGDLTAIRLTKGGHLRVRGQDLQAFIDSAASNQDPAA